MLLSILLFFPVEQANADVGPPPPPVGSDLSPSIDHTNVRMVSEHVLIDIAEFSNYPSGHANVHAKFVMRNESNEEEKMQVRFPMNHTAWDIDEWFKNNGEYCQYSSLPSLKNFQVWVNNHKLDFDISYKTMEDPFRSPNAQGDPVSITVPCWAHFSITFPPEEDVVIDVRYTIPGFNYDGQGLDGQGGGELSFSYVLVTGAGWKGTIGKADIIARLPYEANKINVINCQPDNCEISKDKISWHFEDFEPETNISLDMIRPTMWRKVLQEIENVTNNPDNGEAWGRLGKIYKEILFDPKNYITIHSEYDQTLFDLSREAYQKAVKILPDDEDWQYGFAELLCKRAMGHDHKENWIACIKPLKRCLDIDPNHEAGNDLIEWIHYQQDSNSVNMRIVELSEPEPDYLILTPQLSPAQTLTSSPPPTRTQTPSPTKTQKPSSTFTFPNTPQNSATPTISIESSNINFLNSASLIGILTGSILLAGIIVLAKSLSGGRQQE